MQHLPEAEEFPHQMNPHRTLSMSQWMLGQSFTAIDICTGITERVDLMSIAILGGRASRPSRMVAGQLLRRPAVGDRHA
jgi:hypothetical protein